MTLSDTRWRKASFSGPETNCVEVRRDHEAIRDSKNPEVVLPVSRTATAYLVSRLAD